MSNGIGAEDLVSGTPWWGGQGCGIGDSVEGTIVSAERAQQTDFDSGKPLEWDNGDPRMESVIVIDVDMDKSPTAKRDDLPDDNGQRALHLRGGTYEPRKGHGKAGEKALKDAIQKSGLRAAPGVHIKATITGEAKPTGRGLNPAKLWEIELSEPEPGIEEGDLFD